MENGQLRIDNASCKQIVNPSGSLRGAASRIDRRALSRFFSSSNASVRSCSFVSAVRLPKQDLQVRVRRHADGSPNSQFSIVNYQLQSSLPLSFPRERDAIADRQEAQIDALVAMQLVVERLKEARAFIVRLCVSDETRPEHVVDEHEAAGPQ